MWVAHRIPSATAVLSYMVARGSSPGALFRWVDGCFLTREAAVGTALTNDKGRTGGQGLRRTQLQDWSSHNSSSSRPTGLTHQDARLLYTRYINSPKYFVQGSQVPGIQVVPVTFSHLIAYKLAPPLYAISCLFSCQEGEVVSVRARQTGEMAWWRVITPPESKEWDFPTGRG